MRGASITNHLRILHLLLASEPGGLSKYVIDLAGGMRAAGHEVFAAGERGAGHAGFEAAGIPWIDIPLKHGLIGMLKSTSRLRSWLRDHRIDVIHTHYRRATMLARRIQRKGMPDQIPVLYTLHLSHMVMGYRRWFTDYGDHTHVASVDARAWLIEQRVPEDRITVIPHGIDVSRYPTADDSARRAARASLGIDPSCLVASYVGRFDYPKNEEWLLDLAAATRAQLPQLRILLVGGGPHEAMLRDRIDSENLHDRVQVLSYRDPLPVYQASDLLLLPSIREGFALACAEAMSVGVPVLRTRTSGTSETIVEPLTGRSVPIDHDKFIETAVRMLQHPAGLRRMGAAAAMHVQKYFTFERQMADTVALYRRLAQPLSPPGR